MNKKLQYFYSIPLVSYLKMNGLDIIKTNKHKDTGKTIFYFEVDSKLDELIGKWKRDEYLNNFIKCMKEVKQLVRV